MDVIDMGITADPEQEEEQKRKPTSRELLLQELTSEPEGTRIFALVVNPDGHLAQLVSGNFHIWELQGMITFLGVQLEIAAGSSLVIEDAPDSDVKSPDRVM